MKLEDAALLPPGKLLGLYIEATEAEEWERRHYCDAQERKKLVKDIRAVLRARGLREATEAIEAWGNPRWCAHRIRSAAQKLEETDE